MSSYRFGPFILDTRERRLLHDGEPVPLAPKVFDTLVYLLERQGHLVEKDELMRAVWTDSHVEDGSLPRTIHTLRKALANGGTETRYIETVPTKGYRFAAEVAHINEISKQSASQLAEVQSKTDSEWQRATSKRTLLMMAGVSIAFMIAIVSGWSVLGHGSSSRLPKLKPETDSGGAYKKFQTGRLLMETQTAEQYAAALENFEAATRLDPNFSAAYAGKADAEIYLYWDTGSHDDIAHARVAIEKAIELDPNSSYAHTILCRIRATYDWDFPGAEKECQHAVNLDPGNADARREFAFLLNSIGRRTEALQEMDSAIALEPTSFNKRSRGLLLYYARHFDEAIAQFQQVEKTDPEYFETSRWIARCLEQKKDYAQALEFVIRFRESRGARPDEVAALRRSFALGGWPRILRSAKSDRPNMEAAGNFAQLGEPEKAFEILDKMVRDRRVMIVQMNSEPRLDPLRTDPRFEQLAKRVGLQ